MKRSWKRKGLSVFLLAALIVSVVGISWVWAGRGYYSPQASQVRERWVDWEQRQRFDLNLTPEQKQEFARLKLKFQEETLDLRSQMMKKGIELKKLWLEDTPDKTKIYSLIDEMAQIRANIQKKMVDLFLNLKQILTPEQVEKLPSMRLGWGMGNYPRHCR